MTVIFTKDALRASVEAATGGNVTVLYDDLGYPSYMRVIPKFNIEDIDSDLGSGVHPAFIVGGVEKSEIYVGQYPAIVKDGRALALPGVDPAANLDFDAAKAYCTAKGPGWHLLTNWEWAAVALWCIANDFEPRGNTNYGRHHEQVHEQGRRQDGETPGLTTAETAARTLTGSGPASWRHDNTLSGISDLVGNVWKWVDGLKLIDGVVYMPNDNNFTADEDDWQNQGVVVANDDGTIKLGSTSDTVADIGSTSAGTWRELTTTTNFAALSIAVRQRMQQAMIDPFFTDMPGGNFWFDNDGQRIPLRGGNWNDASYAGLGALALRNARSGVYARIGFVPAFIS